MVANFNLDRVTGGYDGTPVLSTIDLQLPAGKLIVFIGPNAAGKTTLLKLLARQLKPMSGTVNHANQDLWSLSADEAAQQIGYMPQIVPGEVTLPVEQVVALGRAPHRGWFLPYSRQDKDYIADALRRTDLTRVKSTPVHHLSGGQQQRVSLARLLCQRPQTMLLDEPTAHLDPKHQFETFRLLSELVISTKTTVIVTLHDLNQTATWADHVVLIANGTVEAEGSIPDVFTSERLSRVYDIDMTVERPNPLQPPVVRFVR